MNKRWLQLLSFLAILWVSSATEAADWHYVSDHSIYRETKMKTFMDLDSIIDNSDRSKDVWLRTEYDPPMPIQLKNLSHHLLQRRYTLDNTTCLLKTIAYYTDGTEKTFSFGCELKDVNDITSLTPDQLIWDKLFR